MGLDTTHDCWHGAYSAFMRWRTKLAEVAGYPPLMAMEGFFDQGDWFAYVGSGQKVDLVPASVTDAMRNGGPWVNYNAAQVIQRLPIRWDYFRKDPLSILLSHSDCDGEIEAKDCGPIADRLVEILPLMPEGEAGGHIGNWRDKTKDFIDGLRRAAAAGEPVGFH